MILCIWCYYGIFLIKDLLIEWYNNTYEQIFKPDLYEKHYVLRNCGLMGRMARLSQQKEEQYYQIKKEYELGIRTERNWHDFLKYNK